jgi:hypothetical protein
MPVLGLGSRPRFTATPIRVPSKTLYRLSNVALNISKNKIPATECMIALGCGDFDQTCQPLPITLANVAPISAGETTT